MNVYYHLFIHIADEILRSHIQRKWGDGCYGDAPQARVDQIMSAIRRYARVAKKAGMGDGFDDMKVDVSVVCAQGCGSELCQLRRVCVGRDQSIYTRNAVQGLVDGATYRDNPEQPDTYQAILDDLKSLGK